MENERKRTPSGYVWDSCSLKFDLRLMGVSWSVSLATHWMNLVIINVTMIEVIPKMLNMITRRSAEL